MTDHPELGGPPSRAGVSRREALVSARVAGCSFAVRPAGAATIVAASDAMAAAAAATPARGGATLSG